MFTIINRILIIFWYQCGIENCYHYNVKFYIALCYCWNIMMMLEKVSYNDVISISTRNRPISRCKSNKIRCRQKISCLLESVTAPCVFCLMKNDSWFYRYALSYHFIFQQLNCNCLIYLVETIVFGSRSFTYLFKYLFITKISQQINLSLKFENTTQIFPYMFIIFAYFY